jgi:hypothetical protein
MRPELLSNPIDKKLNPATSRAYIDIEVLTVHE